MQENHLYEYAVIRIVPRVEREEFLNVGVILYCQDQRFLQTLFHLDEEKLRLFGCDLDMEEIREHLHAIVQICEGGSNSGPIGQLSQCERFRWLTATRSTIVQPSKVHPGFCEDAGET